MTENLATNINFTHLCRCCALEHNLMYDIFCGTCSNAQTYYEVVMECTPVQLFRDDGLPSLVCHECVSILESFVAFRKKCIESESVLKQMSNDVSSDKQETSDSRRDKPDRPTRDEIKVESSDIDGVVEPETEFDDRESEKLHDSNIYDEIKIENTSDTDLQNDRSDSEIDRRLFESSVYVKEEFVDGESEKRDESVDRKTDERRAEKPYVCDWCDKSFKYQLNLSEHLNIHTGEKPYSCDRCDKSFNCKSNLNQHRKIHTGEKPYSCRRCERSFNCKSNLNQHEKIHTGEKPFPCDRCGRSFRLKTNLREHRNTHTDRKPYSCDECDKSFNCKSNLNEHRKIHTGERPYACDVCEKSFTYKSNLNRHLKVHAAEKRYPCDEERKGRRTVSHGSVVFLS